MVLVDSSEKVVSTGRTCHILYFQEWSRANTWDGEVSDILSNHFLYSVSEDNPTERVYILLWKFKSFFPVSFLIKIEEKSFISLAPFGHNPWLGSEIVIRLPLDYLFLGIINFSFLNLSPGAHFLKL